MAHPYCIFQVTKRKTTSDCIASTIINIASKGPSGIFDYAVPSEFRQFTESFEGKTFCLIRRIYTGTHCSTDRIDPWDKQNPANPIIEGKPASSYAYGVRGEMITRIVSVTQTGRSFAGIQKNCSLIVEDTNGQQYNAWRVYEYKPRHDETTYSILIRNELAEQLEQNSYYTYSGPLAPKEERIEMIPLDNIEAEKAMEQIRRRQEISNEWLNRDRLMKEAALRKAEEVRQAELERQQVYAEQNDAEKSNALRLFRSFGKK